MTLTVFICLLIPFIGTTLGSAMVFFLKKVINGKFQKILLGFASEVMIAAGAMMYVVVEELIPEMSEGEHSNIGVIMFSLGFVLMMALDVALG